MDDPDPLPDDPEAVVPDHTTTQLAVSGNDTCPVSLSAPEASVPTSPLPVPTMTPVFEAPEEEVGGGSTAPVSVLPLAVVTPDQDAGDESTTPEPLSDG